MLKCHYNNFLFCLGLQRPSPLSPWRWSSPFQEYSCQVNFKPKITFQARGKHQVFGGCPHWWEEQENLARERLRHGLGCSGPWSSCHSNPCSSPGCSRGQDVDPSLSPWQRIPLLWWHSSVIALRSPGLCQAEMAVPHCPAALLSSPFALSPVWVPNTRFWLQGQREERRNSLS